jgi:energy-coupling factor transport system ATP-binding protein
MSIELRNVNYVYDSGEPFEFFALQGISLRIEDGAFVGIVGRTGSGKSTLVEHLNGLLFPTQGEVVVDGAIVRNDRAVLAAVRRRVGIVFQYPEDQFFAETVYEEVAFGCRNYGFSKERVEESVRKAMQTVGLDPEHFMPLSPFQLSGGEQRRVAIASIVAMGQKYVVLDEPTAGLDSSSKLAILAELESLRQTANVTVILVSHNMDEVAEFCKQVIVLNEGTVAFQGSTDAFFRDAALVSQTGLELPESYRLARALKACGSDLSVNERSTGRMLDSLKMCISEQGQV